MKWGLRLLTAILWVVVLGLIVQRGRTPPRFWGADLYLVDVAARAVKDADSLGIAPLDIYQADVQSKIGKARLQAAQASSNHPLELAAARANHSLYPNYIAVNGSPTWLGLFALAPLPSFDRLAMLWRIGAMISVLFSFIWVGRAVGLAAPLVAGALVFWLGYGEPLLSDLEFCNVSAYLLGALAGSIALLRRDGDRGIILGGALLGFAATVKPVLVPAVLFVPAMECLVGQWRRALGLSAGIVCGVAVAAVLGTVAFGDPHAWLAWWAAATAQAAQPYSLYSGNLALVNLVQGTPQMATMLSLSAVGLLGLLVWRRCRNESDAGRRAVLASGLGVSAYLLTSPVVWAHYLVLFLPVWIMALSRRGTARLAAVACGCLLAGRGLWSHFGFAPNPGQLGALLMTGMLGTMLLVTLGMPA
ncbi:MAG: hypothetical protein GXP62_20630, partial [Oligoflexia bacterium]|nr:hypothetical protein [Oligoflexia bacterium]